MKVDVKYQKEKFEPGNVFLVNEVPGQNELDNFAVIPVNRNTQYRLENPLKKKNLERWILTFRWVDFLNFDRLVDPFIHFPQLGTLNPITVKKSNFGHWKYVQKGFLFQIMNLGKIETLYLNKKQIDAAIRLTIKTRMEDFKMVITEMDLNEKISATELAGGVVERRKVNNTGVCGEYITLRRGLSCNTYFKGIHKKDNEFVIEWVN